MSPEALALLFSFQHRMSSTPPTHLQTPESDFRRIPKTNRHLEEHVHRALNKIRKPSTAEEIAELLNRDLGPGELPFEPKEIEAWLRQSHEEVLNLYWLGTRPRR
jgi:hypothetical protein